MQAGQRGGVDPKYPCDVREAVGLCAPVLERRPGGPIRLDLLLWDRGPQDGDTAGI